MIKGLYVTVGVCCFIWAAAGPSEAATRTVCASGCAYTDLQAAIDAATYGDVILLRAGQTFTGHFILRAKSGSGSIEIRSDAPESSLPGSSQRLVPSDRGGPVARSSLARLVGRGGTYRTTPLLRTEPGAHGYVVRFVEFDGAAQAGYETLIQLGTDTTASPPYDIVLDRVYVHGDRYKGQKRGVTLNGIRLSVLNSYVSDIKAVDYDSQAILGYNGAGPLRIENNYLEAAAENIMFGGADPAVYNLVPSDIAIRRNHLSKPFSWQKPILASPASPRAAAAGSGSLPSGTHYFKVVAVMATGPRTAVSVPSTEVSATVPSNGAITVSWSRVSGADRYRIYRGTSPGGQKAFLETTGSSLTYTGASELSGTPLAAGTKWLVKNLLELKNAQRVTIDGNTFENSWAAGQAGYAFMFTPANSGTAPWTRVQDVTVTNNVVRRAAGVVNISGFDHNDPSMRTKRITFRNNLFYDIDHTKYGASAKALLVGNGAAALVFDRNTIVHTSTSVLFAYGEAMQELVYTANISQHYQYGIMGSGSSTGAPTLAKYFPGAVVRCNVLAGGSPPLYPTPNAFPSVAEWHASFVDPAREDYRLRPGSPVAAGGCNGIPPGADFAALGAAFAASGSGTATAPVTTTNQPPVVAPGGPYTTTTGALVAVDGTRSSDPDGSVLDYRWSWGDEVLVRAADLPAAAIRGSEWVRVESGDAAGGALLLNPDKGAPKRSPLAAPGSYVEFTVHAAAGVPYYLWMRLRATNNTYTNDSLSLQFSGAVDAQGNAVARIGTTNGLSMILEDNQGAGVSGWGWADRMYGGPAAPVYFARTGAQTIRIQAREDGVAWDQLVLSRAKYTSFPGRLKADTTYISPDLGISTGATAAHRYEKPGIYPLVLTVTDAGGASATGTTTVTVK